MKMDAIKVLGLEVLDDPKLMGDSEEVPIFECSGWRFNSHYEIFSPLDGKKNKVGR